MYGGRRCGWRALRCGWRTRGIRGGTEKYFDWSGNGVGVNCLWTKVSKIIWPLLLLNEFGDCIRILKESRRVWVRICPGVPKVLLGSQLLSWSFQVFEKDLYSKDWTGG